MNFTDEEIKLIMRALAKYSRLTPHQDETDMADKLFIRFDKARNIEVRIVE